MSAKLKYDLNGVEKTLREWCAEYDQPFQRVYMRMRRGVSLEEALGAKLFAHTDHRKESVKDIHVEMDGRRQTLRAWCTELGLTYNAVLKRTHRGWNPVDALLAGTDERISVSTHGMTKTKVYHAWNGMKARCGNPKATSYASYGGRGITYDPEWESFENFYRDMGDPPEGTSIERVDVNGNYCKENCIWATNEVQSRNRRTNRYLTIGSETKIIGDWCKEYDVTAATINRRIKSGMSIVDAITKNGKR